MIRKLGILGATVALGVGMLGVGTAGAAKPTVNASGTMHCTVTGKVKIAPNPLVFSSTAGSTVFAAKIKSSACTGSSGVTKAQGTLTATLPTSDCTSLAALPFPAASFGTKVKFKGAAKYNSSTTSFTAGGTFGVTDPITMDLPGGGTSSVGSGSFAGQHPHFHFQYLEGTAVFANNCQPKGSKDSTGHKIKGSGGLKKMTISSGSYIDYPGS
jgi:hypothetical protein